MAQMAQTLGQLPFNSILGEIFCTEVASVVIGFLIFYVVQTGFLSHWGPTARKASKLVAKTAELNEKTCDNLESVPASPPASPPLTTTTPGSTACNQKTRKMESFFAQRTQQRQDHIQNFRPKEATTTEIKSVSSDPPKTGSFFGDRQQQRQGHIQNFRPPVLSRHSNLGPTGPPPGLEQMSEAAVPDRRVPAMDGRRSDRRTPATLATTIATKSSVDPLIESLGCTGLNGNEEALMKLWTDVMSVPMKDATTSVAMGTHSSTAMTNRRTRARPNEGKRF